MNDDASVIMFQTQSAVWTPVSARERIRKRHDATQATPESTQVNDAGALAPVVFSDQPNPQTCKIRRIKRKRAPYPPKSRAANTMVVFVCPENTCTNQFDSNSSRCPCHGDLSSMRASLHVMIQMHTNGYPEFKYANENSQKRMNYKKQN